MKKIKKQEIEKLPSLPGVYAFLDEKERVLYVGKAKNLKNRVKTHFKNRSFRDSLFIDQVKFIGIEKTQSEIEALLRESSLIKKLQPKFNVLWKDDTNYFWVGVTNERFPRVFITHQPQKEITAKYVGPFVDGKSLKTTLKALRKIFPYRSCKKIPSKPCMWYHLGLCPGPCTVKRLEEKGERTLVLFVEQETQKNAKMILEVLKGKKTKVLNDLKKEMFQFSEKREYERAAQKREQIFALENVLSHAQVIKELPQKDFDWEKTEKKLRQFLGIKNKIKRIEGYDVSNIQGNDATASMVVFKNGFPCKDDYRRFKIKTQTKPNDIAMLKEAIARRLNHSEWHMPEVILVDGGKAQLNATEQVINKKSKNIKIIALAKRKNELFVQGNKKSFLLKNLPEEISDLILKIRDEAHRFALRYHQKLRHKKLLNLS